MSDEGLDNVLNVILINTVLTSSKVSASPFSIDIILIIKMYGCLCCNNIFVDLNKTIVKKCYNATMTIHFIYVFFFFGIYII